MFKNMKIPVEKNLNEIVLELNRLGYTSTGFPNVTNPTRSIRTVKNEKYSHVKQFEFLAWHINAIDDFWKLTTLVELKLMK